jgi:hypothetical protein
MTSILYQIHGYKNGHQLISQNLRLEKTSQDLVDRLSDISGPLRPGEIFNPYFTCYPLPSKEYFVLARTWQDLSVSRAGCVLTKSIFIPISEWKLDSSPMVYFTLLSNETNERLIVSAEFPSIEKAQFPVVSDPGEELVEAVFVGTRQPIALFGCTAVDSVILRLYSAFWGKLRDNFSICTYALSQRFIGGKPFDLLFVPENAKAKFSDWPGKRIEMSMSTTKVSRHRWAKELAKRIFLDNPVKPLNESFSNFIATDGQGDENLLRLNLLWNELEEKAHNEISPIAVLGLLDIINSRSTFDSTLYLKIKPLIEETILEAHRVLPVTDAWIFYSALLAKHKLNKMSRQMMQSVKSACAQLVVINSEAAILFVETLNSKSPSILFAGLGDGFAEVSDKSILAKIQNANPEILVRLLSTSKSFAHYLSIILVDPDFDKHSIGDFLNSSNQREYIRAVDNIFLFISSADQSKLAEYLLRKIDSTLFSKVVVQLGMNTGFTVREFDPALLENTERLGEFESVLKTVLKYNRSNSANSLIGNLLRSDATLITEFIKSELSDERKLKILVSVLKQSFDLFAPKLSRSETLSKKVLALFSNSREDSCGLYANLVTISKISEREALLILNNLPEDALKEINKIYLAPFLVRLFSNNTYSDSDLLSSFIWRLSKSYKQNFIELAITPKMEPARVINNIKLLFNSGTIVKDGLSNEIEIVSYLLVTNFRAPLDVDLIKDWVDLFFKVSDTDKQQKAAAIIVSNALNTVHYDPTMLLVASFPILYNSTLQRTSTDNQILSNLFRKKDKGKSLLVRLVDKYINSNWSRVGLLNISIATDVLRTVIEILIHSKGGKKYLTKAFSEAKSIKLPKNHPIIREFKRLYR